MTYPLDPMTSFQVTRSSWRICPSTTETSSRSWTAEVGLLSTPQPFRQTRPFWSSRSKVCVLGPSPLHRPAVASHSVSCCPASGADSVDCRTPRGQTPLFLAVEEGLMENASFLLQHGAQANSQDQELESPLLTGREGRLHVWLCMQFTTTQLCTLPFMCSCCVWLLFK